MNGIRKRIVVVIAMAGLAAGMVAAVPAFSLTANPEGAPCNHTDRKARHNSGRWVARLYAPGHHPHVGNWEIKVTAKTLSGAPISGGRIYYQFLFGDSIVACRYVGKPRAPRFNSRGIFRDVLVWPKRAIGYKLTLRVVAITRKGVRNLNYSVQVQR